MVRWKLGAVLALLLSVASIPAFAQSAGTVNICGPSRCPGSPQISDVIINNAVNSALTSKANTQGGVLNSPTINSPTITNWVAPPASLPLATTSSIGGVQVGTGLSVSTGILGLPSVNTSGAGTYGPITTDAQGRITAARAPAFTDVTGSATLGQLPTIPTTKISGLAASATTDTTNATNIVSGTLGLARIPTIPASQTSGLAATANNLSDLASTTTARTNLGLGTAATVNTGQSGSTVPLLNASSLTWSGVSQTFGGSGSNSITITPGSTTSTSTIIQGNGTAQLRILPPISGLWIQPSTVTLPSTNSTLPQVYLLNTTIGGSAPASYTSGPFARLLINDNIDLLTNGNAAVYDFWAQTNLGTGWNGNRNSIQGALAVTAPASQATNGFIAGAGLSATTAFPMDGTSGGTGTPHGNIAAFDYQTTLNSGALDYTIAEGFEGGVTLNSGTSAQVVNGAKITTTGCAFASHCIGIELGSADGSLPLGISFGGSESPNFPISTTGTLIGITAYSGGNTRTFSHGIDLSNGTCSIDCFKSSGFQVDGSGNASTQKITVNGHIASAGIVPTVSAGTINTSSTDTRGSVALAAATVSTVVTFYTAYATAPFCIAGSSVGADAPAVTATSTTTVSLAVTANASGTTVTYQCMQ